MSTAIRLTPTERLAVRGAIAAPIVQVVCDVFGIAETKLRSESRDAHVSEARQAAWYIAHLFSDLSFGEIGMLIGGREKCGVRYGIRRSLERCHFASKFSTNLKAAIDRLDASRAKGDAAA